MKTLADANTFAEAEINQRLTGEEKTHLLREMFRIRRFEQAALKQYQTSGQIGGFLHLYIGQESVAVGTLSLCGTDDHVIAGYRSHGNALTMGMSMNECMAELFGKATGCYQCGRIWLFVFAIALHNLPEGMAIGVSFSQGDLRVGLPLTTAIALQDIPEGLAVALALRGAGFAPGVAVLVAAASGILEPLGALLGVGLSSGLALAYPIGLGLAAGAMLFVVSHEVIPETHRNGHQTAATLGLMVGFALMMVLDTSLG